MPVYYGYSNAIFGTQSTVNGAAHNYNFAPATNSTWSWTGVSTSFHVRENNGAVNYNGDPTNEQVSTQEQIGQTWEQVTNIGGTYYQTIYDYTFTITAPDGVTTYRVAVIDVDLNNDNDLSDAGEDGYYLVFPDGIPPAGVNYTVNGITDNSTFIAHNTLGAAIVCFASGTLIDTPDGKRPVEELEAGDVVETKDDGPQVLIWTGSRRVHATGEFAPVVISKGIIGNEDDLILSPQHRVLVSGWKAQLLFGEDEVLVKAKDLVDGDRVYRKPGGYITYHHILFESHQVVFAHGAPAESFHPGPQALSALDRGPKRELLRLFPELHRCAAPVIEAARMSLRSFEADCLIAV